jgi:purine-nucleoside phosphorylase
MYLDVTYIELITSDLEVSWAQTYTRSYNKFVKSQNILTFEGKYRGTTHSTNFYFNSICRIL